MDAVGFVEFDDGDLSSVAGRERRPVDLALLEPVDDTGGLDGSGGQAQEPADCPGALRDAGGTLGQQRPFLRGALTCDERVGRLRRRGGDGDRSDCYEGRPWKESFGTWCSSIGPHWQLGHWGSHGPALPDQM